MTTCDALIVGGGPAGSSCAWRLRQAGMDVLVIDKATFPRDKVCAGWITPEVITELQIDVPEYRHGRTFQPITAFRVGIIGTREVVDVEYRRPVSFGIRRCEFDHYLLQRSGARLVSGTAVASIRRDNGHWILNEQLRAPLLVGAGGHFCPVARMLNPDAVAAPLVAAQEAEFVTEPATAWPTEGERPELYFCADLRGYGWCFRKGEYLNVGFGRFDARALPKATSTFVDYLKARRRVPLDVSLRWRGHAYLVSGAASRRAVGDDVMLIGDAAGLAYPQSGEGIRPAIESGLLAASSILKANGAYTIDRLIPYATRLRERYGAGRLGRVVSHVLPDGAASALAGLLMRNQWFIQHVLLDRWFLHRTDPSPLAAS